MPQFPEKDSLLLSKLFKSAPWMAKLHETKDDSAATPPTNKINHPKPEVPAPSAPATISSLTAGDQGLVDLLGITTEASPPPPVYGRYYLFPAN